MKFHHKGTKNTKENERAAGISFFFLSIVPLWCIFPPLKRNSLDAMLEQCDIKIQEQPQANSRQFQVSENLRLMDRQYRIDGFDFDNNFRSNQQIKSISRVDAFAFIDDRQHNLPLHRKPSTGQFMRKTMFISTLQQSRPEKPVHLQASIYNLARGLLANLADCFMCHASASPQRHKEHKDEFLRRRHFFLLRVLRAFVVNLLPKTSNQPVIIL